MNLVDRRIEATANTRLQILCQASLVKSNDRMIDIVDSDSVDRKKSRRIGKQTHMYLENLGSRISGL